MMGEVRFENPSAMVFEIWGGISDATLLGVFQYERDAALFCKARIDEGKLDPCVALVVVEHRTGKMCVFRQVLSTAKTTADKGVGS